jgi:alpha-tubulin suppressor-like RCC1 family protein
VKKFLLPLAVVGLMLAGCGTQPQPGLSLSLSQTTLNVAQGNSVQVSLTLAPQNGLTGTVNLALQSPPPGVTLSLTSVSLSGSAPQSVTLTLATTSATPIQDHPLTLEASQGSLRKTANLTLKVTGFTASLSPASATVNPGQSASTTLTITPQNGFSGTVDLSLQSPPEGVSLTPSSVNVTGSGAQNFTLEIQTTGATPLQTHNLTLRASQGNFSVTATFELNVTAAPQPNFEIALNPTSGTVVQNNAISATLTLTPQNGFSGTVNLSLQSPPAGVSVSPASITVSGAAAQDFTVTFNTTTATPTGPSTLTLVATQGSLSKTASFDLTVTSFDIALTRSSTMRAQGQNFSDFDLTLTPQAGFSGPVNLSLQSPPSGISIGPASLSASGPVTLTVARTVPEGVYNLTVQASSGNLTRTAPLTLRVLRATTLAAGGYFSAAIKPNGEVWSWGDNTHGQLGRATSGFSDNTPARVSTTNDVVSVSLGEYHALALTNDGRVVTVGRDDFGQLGDGPGDSSDTSSAPNLRDNILPAGVKAVAVEAGRYYSLALTSEGTVYAWGRNNVGQLGLGTTAQQDSPALISDFNGVIALAAGDDHTLALKADGTVWAWGDNPNGELGTGNLLPSYVPVVVAGLSDVKAIAAGGNHSVALLADGTVRTWGYNNHGQLGNGNTTDSNVPVQVTGLTDVVGIAAGYEFTLAVLSNGTVKAWGHDDSLQLGNGATAGDQTTPVDVQGIPSDRSVRGLAAGIFHALALLDDGSVVAWGSNVQGQLGDGTINSSDVAKPASVTGVQVPPAP